MAWRLANSLTTLRNQVNAAYPARNKASDGTIGDAAHSSRTSQHNPNPAGVVTAIDITHDPAHGVNGQVLADALITDSRAWYVIFNRRIRYYGGAWQAYSGSNPHTAHVHLSTKQDAGNYDNSRNWNLSTSAPQGGMPVADETLVNIIYGAFLGRAPDPGGMANYRGKPLDFVVKDVNNSQEHKNYWSSIQGNNKRIADLEAALRNEQNKPPKEVVKEVEKIVEKVVEVPVEKIVRVEVEKPVDEKKVVENWLVKLWNRLFSKGA